MNATLERTARGFDRLSPHYDALVRLLPGRAIPRSQTLFLERVRNCRRALIIGGGTGEFLAALLASGFRGSVLNLDISEGMQRRSEHRARSLGPAALSRVEFRRGGIAEIAGDERFDLVCTHCFLDLFTARQLGPVVARLDEVLDPGGIWLCSDFAEPAARGGLRAAAHRGLLSVLYRFFGWACGVEPRRLPPIRAALAAQGLVPTVVRYSAAGLLWSGCFRRPVPPPSYNLET